jgi:hypothetical protein
MLLPVFLAPTASGGNLLSLLVTQGANDGLDFVARLVGAARVQAPRNSLPGRE